MTNKPDTFFMNTKKLRNWWKEWKGVAMFYILIALIGIAYIGILQGYVAPHTQCNTCETNCLLLQGTFKRFTSTHFGADQRCICLLNGTYIDIYNSE